MENTKNRSKIIFERVLPFVKPLGLCLLVLACLLILLAFRGVLAFGSESTQVSWQHRARPEILSQTHQGTQRSDGDWSWRTVASMGWLGRSVDKIKSACLSLTNKLQKWSGTSHFESIKVPHRTRFEFNEMVFNSEFESGNMEQVRRVNAGHFRVKIGSDRVKNEELAEKKNWFYFEVSGVKRSGKVRLSIGTLNRNWSMWKHGLVPVYKSSLRNGQWRIFDLSETSLIMKKKGLWLELEYPFEEGERVAFALTYPYTTRKLARYLDKIETQVAGLESDLIIHRDTLINSNLDQPVELLWIGSRSNQTSRKMRKMKNLFPDGRKSRPFMFKNRCNVIVSARVHPSETASNFLLEGFLNHFLRKGKRVKSQNTKADNQERELKNTENRVNFDENLNTNKKGMNAEYNHNTGQNLSIAQRIKNWWYGPTTKPEYHIRKDMASFLKRCNLIVIPMLNPDGVRLGRTRTDANGINLNNFYRHADLSTPSIYALKKFVRSFHNLHRINFFFDLHSHFTRRGAFLFGNPLKAKSYKKVLSFPYLFHRFEKEFSMRKSSFGSDKAESTSRKEISRFARLKRVYTIEVNYWGNKRRMSNLRKGKRIHYNIRKVSGTEGFYKRKDFRRMGANLAKSLVEYFKLRRKSRAKDRAKIERRAERFFKRHKNWRYGKAAAEKKRKSRKRGKRGKKDKAKKKLQKKSKNKRIVSEDNQSAKMEDLKNEKSKGAGSKEGKGTSDGILKGIEGSETGNENRVKLTDVFEDLAEIPFKLDSQNRKARRIQFQPIETVKPVRKKKTINKNKKKNKKKKKTKKNEKNRKGKQSKTQKKNKQHKKHGQKANKRRKLANNKRVRGAKLSNSSFPASKIDFLTNDKRADIAKFPGYDYVWNSHKPHHPSVADPPFDADHPESEFCKGAFTFSQCLTDLKKSEQERSIRQKNKSERSTIWQSPLYEQANLSSHKFQILEYTPMSTETENLDELLDRSEQSEVLSRFPVSAERIQMPKVKGDLNLQEFEFPISFERGN